MTVRTKVLVSTHGHATNAEPLVATVPVGKTWIMKDIRVTNFSAGTRLLTITVRRGGTIALAIDVSVAAYKSVRQIDDWLVLDEGDEVFVKAGGAAAADSGAHFWISGTELDGIAP